VEASGGFGAPGSPLPPIRGDSFVLSFQLSLLGCYGSCFLGDASVKLCFRGWLGLAGSVVGSVSWKLHLKQLHAAAASDLPSV
jgi:hypothetical protein